MLNLVMSAFQRSGPRIIKWDASVKALKYGINRHCRTLSVCDGGSFLNKGYCFLWLKDDAEACTYKKTQYHYPL